LSRSPPDFTIAQPSRLRGASAKPFDRTDYISRLRVAIGKASASLKKHQRRYKQDFDKRIRKSVGLTTDDKVFLDLNDGAKKRDKLSSGVGGAYEVLEVNKETKTVVIQRGDVTERVSMNRVTRAPASAKVVGPSPPYPHAATQRDLSEKTTTGRSYYFKSILDHRTLADGTVEFKLDWEGYRPTWQPRQDVPEESISRYLARLATRRAREAAQSSVNLFVPPSLPPPLPRSAYSDIVDHRIDHTGAVHLLVAWHSFPPTWVPRSRVAQRDAETYFTGVANAALLRL